MDLKISIILLQVEYTCTLIGHLLQQVLNKPEMILATSIIYSSIKRRAIQSRSVTCPWLCTSLAAWLFQGPGQHGF